MKFSSLISQSSLCVGLLALQACEPGSNQADQIRPAEAEEGMRARATIAGPPGSAIKGEVTLVELEGNAPVPGVQIEARITGSAEELTPGLHGLHIHENAKGGCVPPYETAGGHFDPGPASNPDPDVNHPFHMGDVPNLVVGEGGSGEMKATTSRVTLSPGPLSVFDANGSVIILHEKPDQGIPGAAKSGVSGGPRIACGVVEKDST